MNGEFIFLVVFMLLRGESKSQCKTFCFNYLTRCNLSVKIEPCLFKHESIEQKKTE